MDEKDKLIKEQRARIKELETMLFDEWHEGWDEPDVDEPTTFDVIWEYKHTRPGIAGPYRAYLEYFPGRDGNQGVWDLNDTMLKGEAQGWDPQIIYWREILEAKEIINAMYVSMEG